MLVIGWGSIAVIGSIVEIGSIVGELERTRELRILELSNIRMVQLYERISNLEFSIFLGYFYFYNIKKENVKCI